MTESRTVPLGTTPGLPRELPRVVIDARMVREIPHGFARYVTALATGLDQLRAQSPLPYEPFFLMSPHYATQAGAPAIFRKFSWKASRSDAHSLAELRILPEEIRAAQADLFHSPSYVSLLRCPCPHVSTVHDLNHLIYGDLKQKVYYRFVLKPFLKRARRILTVSEFSRREIAEWLKIPASEISVVYNAVTAPVLSGGSDEAELTQLGLTAGQYFLALSNAKPHKNLPLLVRAYRQAKKECPALWPLVLSVSPESLNVALADPGIRCVGGISDALGSVLIRHCGAVPFPSLYEGFGLPPLEAALARRRILVSDIAPHREALQDFSENEVVWLDPKKESEWARALITVFNDNARLVPPSETSVVAALARFSTLRLATDMDRIYQNVLAL